MSLTLLLDLDNTLLGNDMEVFLPAYFRSLSGHVASHVDPQAFIECLLAATSRAIENDLPHQTLQETFERYFYSGIGLPREVLQPEIDAFYNQVFPGLRQHTQRLPAAVSLIETARQRGYRVAIATNPLFPRQAILQRLIWSGIPDSEYRYDLVASYESFHFAKPNPAFFTEVLARLGWPKGQTVVVGDDLENDINPALTLGIPTYHIIQNQEHPGNRSPADGSGILEDFIPWLDRIAPEKLTPTFDTPPALLGVLASTPAALDSIVASTGDRSLHWKPAPEEWGITEVLCHLRDVEKEVQLPRIQRIVEEDNPFLSAEDTDAWADQRRYAAQDGRQALSDFMAARAETLRLLRALPESGWNRRARHAIFGPTQLIELVRIIAEHDRLHLRQINRLSAWESAS